MSSHHRRGPWSQGEDAYLVELVRTQGALNWVRIAQLIGSRSPKQCRERYHQNLKPTLNHEPIGPEEGLLIERLVAEMGKKWAEIARRLHGRSDNAVKNWWNGSMNRRRRSVVRRAGGGGGGGGGAASSLRSPCQVDEDSTYEGMPSLMRTPDNQGNGSLPISSSSSKSPSSLSSTCYSTLRRPSVQSLPSPSASEISRTSSLDAPLPSLISDTRFTSSALSSRSWTSRSFRSSASPRFELPPPGAPGFVNGHRHGHRHSTTYHRRSTSRSSLLPALQLRGGRGVSFNREASPCSTQQPHVQTYTLQLPNIREPRTLISPPSSSASVAPVPVDPVQLAPMHSQSLQCHHETAGNPENPIQRDARMRLSSLLE